jgi:hypothetical protein
MFAVRTLMQATRKVRASITSSVKRKEGVASLVAAR